MAATNDLYALLNQSTSDKLLSSVSYPFTVFETRQDFPGCIGQPSIGSGAPLHRYSNEEVDVIFKNAVEKIVEDPGQRSMAIDDTIFSFGGSILQQAKLVLNSMREAPIDGPKAYVGPSEKDLEAIVNGGIRELPSALRKIRSDWGLYAWCSYLSVVLKVQPSIALNSPRIDLDNFKISVTATGEIWAKYPWLNCYQWCTQWQQVTKCDCIASATVTVDIKANAHAIISTNAAQVYAQAVFDILRIDADILDKIPLEGIANSALQGKLINVFDASKLIATVPVLKTTFSIDSVLLPQTANGIGIGVVLKQI
jgi:hypothetical protein